MDVPTNTLIFWSIAAVMVAVALAFVLPRLLRPGARSADARAERHALNVEVYRSQLADLDRDLANGLLSATEHATAADDVRRRLLEEGAAGGRSAGGASRSPRAAVVTAVLVPMLAVLLYLTFGSPRSIEDSEAAADALSDESLPPEGRAAALAEMLEAHLARQPEDARAWVLLGRARMATDRFPEAVAAYERATALSGRVARDPEVLCELADAIGMAQGGRLAGRPWELVQQALALAPEHPKALEMAGSAEYEARNFKGALAYWERLLAQLPEASPRYRELAAAIDRTRRLAGAG